MKTDNHPAQKKVRECEMLQKITVDSVWEKKSCCVLQAFNEL